MPYSLNEEQIDFILNDIRKRGIEMEKLQINLLDHICVLLEDRMKEGDDFTKVYEEVIKEFFEKDLKEIENETKKLLKNNHYYKMKKFWYFVLFVSLGYNVFMILKGGINYFEYKNDMKEWKELEKITFKEGYDNLLLRLKEEDPNIKIKDYICVSFLGQPVSEEQREAFGRSKDTASERLQLIMLEHHYKTIDSLASLFHKNVTYIFAFETRYIERFFANEGIEKTTNEFIKAEQKKFKNVIFLKYLDKLMVGYANQRKQEGRFCPTIFIIDKNAKIVFNNNYFINPQIYLANFLRNRPN